MTNEHMIALQNVAAAAKEAHAAAASRSLIRARIEELNIALKTACQREETAHCRLANALLELEKLRPV